MPLGLFGRLPSNDWCNRGVVRVGRLTEWCQTQPTWARDALHRAALADEISQADVDSVAVRVAAAHGIPDLCAHACEDFSEASLKTGAGGLDQVILCSVGPLEGVDRLADDQELKFALTGVTLVFGDNASGKSGYVRALRQLCHARVAGRLRNDVFARLGQSNPIRVSYSYQEGAAESLKKTWALDDPRPPELSSIAVLDTENARVYVEGENEILFLPPEVNSLTRLGKLYTVVAAKFQHDADAVASAHGGPFGASYDSSTTAGKLIQSLKISQTSLATEDQLKAAANWDDKLEREFTEIESKLAQAPHIAAAKCIRASTALQRVVTLFRERLLQVNDEALANAHHELVDRRRSRDAARVLAADQIGGQPIATTGSDTWKALFQYARQFVAEAGIRPLEQSFQIGDPCPLCQRPLDERSAERLTAFDVFIEGKANSDAQAAAERVQKRIEDLKQLSISSDAELEQFLAEFAAHSEDAGILTKSAITFNASIRNRRERLLECLALDELPAFEPMPDPPTAQLTETAARLSNESKTLLDSEGVDSKLLDRSKELRDQKRLHDQLEEVLARRNALDLRLKQLKCVAALSTLAVSRLATAIRKDLVTPDLNRRISEELACLGLSHIPLKFDEKTERGTSFFEVALATDQRAAKESVLSEGEQRALSIACFLAESHVAGRKSAIIFDDPVTSLDHKRLRRVAERLVREASGRQIVIFTHNMLFYQEVLRSCTDQDPQIPVLPCVVRQHSADRFGLITNNDKPWVAKKVKEREHDLEQRLHAIPDILAPDSEELRRAAILFYAELRETWERAVEEILLNAVIERFGTDVRTQSLKGVEVTDEDYRVVFKGMKRASEYSGHDRAAGRQLDPPTKDQMRSDLDELRAFRTARHRRRNELQEERKKLEEAPAATTI